MGVYIGTSNPLQNAYIGEYVEGQTVQTFDFQNDGALNWTGASLYGTPYFVTGEGWCIWGDLSQDTFQSPILPPSSVYDGKKLTNRKIWFYKGVGSYVQNTYVCSVGAGIGASSNLIPSVMREQGGPYDYSHTSFCNIYTGSDTKISTTSQTGEVLLEYIFEDDGTMKMKVNNTSYTLGNYASTFRTAWTNSRLGLQIGTWEVPEGSVYIRKTQITTMSS